MTTLPAGKYLIGDLCYRDAVWDEMIEPFILNELRTLSNGKRYVILKTAYGDGEYMDQDGKRYWVDSGTIGIVECDGDEDTPQGRVFDFGSEFNVYNDNGEMHFGALVIETNPEMDMDIDFGDHGPTEYQEWHDYDADC